MRISHPKDYWSLLRSIMSVTFAKKQETSNPLQPGAPRRRRSHSYYPLRGSRQHTELLFDRVFLSVLVLQISSQFVKCRRQNLPHEFTEI